MKTAIQNDQQKISIPLDSVSLHGTLQIPPGAKGVVVFVPDSGCCHNRHSHSCLAQVLLRGGLASLLLDLLTPEEEETDLRTRYCLRHSIRLLSERLLGATDWLKHNGSTKTLKVGYFASNSGACAALAAAAKRPDAVGAIVSRSGYLDLVTPILSTVQAPTLLIVGEKDFLGVGMGEDAIAQLQGKTQLERIEGATHLLQEQGASDRVGQLAKDWFISHLRSEK